MSDIELLGRLFLSLLFGTLVGIERQWHHKTAGLKTNTLVAIGSTAFALVSARGLGPNVNLAQVAGGIVTGIGFIGAGVIMRQGGSVQGINSAAMLWVTASMGLAVGVGYYKLAWLVLAAILVIQILLRKVANWIDDRSGQITPSIKYRMLVSFIPAAAEGVRSAWSAFAGQTGVSVTNYNESKNGSSETVLELSFNLSSKRACEMATLGQKLAEIPGVNKAEWSQSTVEKEE